MNDMHNTDGFWKEASQYARRPEIREQEQTLLAEEQDILLALTKRMKEHHKQESTLSSIEQLLCEKESLFDDKWSRLYRRFLYANLLNLQ